ncbi:OPT oligopeptide transporter protein-domain-containing protein [Russula compacta]|nr:OPT oligopeptide transporter protein-domain-containing protein [Russula compacta]
MDSNLETLPSLPKQDAPDLPLEEKHSLSEKEKDLEPAPDSGVIDVLRNERELVTRVISVDDDPSLNPYTIRSVLIGSGLSLFAGTIAEIYYFKPQTVFVSTMFLAVLSYLIGRSIEIVLPSSGWFRYLNPCGCNSAMAAEVFAVQALFYKDVKSSKLAAMLVVSSSQFLGYGIAGLLRPALVYPSKMLYPSILPLISALDAFHDNSSAKQFESNEKKKRIFYTAFLTIFIWELFPEYIFPLLTGFSVFCLAHPTSPGFTRVFGGSNNNEGLGLLSLSFDWNYISAAWNPFVIPLKAQFSVLIGYILCIIVSLAAYYNNTWASKNFPFLSQKLFYENGTVYDPLLILNNSSEVDPTLLAQQGLPYFSGTWIIYLLAANMGLAATITHLLLWNCDDLRPAWSWMNRDSLRRGWEGFNWKFWEDDIPGVPADANADPHYREMCKYPDAQNHLYAVMLVSLLVVVPTILHGAGSTLTWWGFYIAVILAAISLLFHGALSAMTGITFIVQPFVQMIGGFLFPGKPMANMFFVLYSYNSVNQGELLLRNLKIAQYTKLPPRGAFIAQLLGTFLGSNLNSVMSTSILTNQHAILKSVEGTDVWSGQQLQRFNWQIMAWSLPQELFATGGRYQWVAWGFPLGLVIPIPFWFIHRHYPRLRGDYLYTPIILWCIGVLSVGISSAFTAYFVVAWFSQWFLRTRHPKWFAKYNYILGGALDAGTHIMVFILSFAVHGATKTSHMFPKWWGANYSGNYDRCAVTTS